MPITTAFICFHCENRFFGKGTRARKFCSKNCRAMAYYNANREQIREKRKLIPLARRRRYRIKYLYGITIDRWNCMYKEQSGACAICASNRVKLVVDHCHLTGLVRGLLCNDCNAAIGYGKDNPSVLRSAARYLDRHSSVKSAS